MNATTHGSVLFIGAFPRPAALERFVSGDLAQRLERLGWRVKVTARHPSRLLRFGQLLLQTWQQAPLCDVACVDVFSGSAFLWAEAACAILRRAAKPYALTLHGGNLPAFSRQHPARVKKLLASAATVTCPSRYLATELGHFRPELKLIPNGIDLSSYQTREPRPPFHHLIWLRAFHDIYNPVMAVEVLAKLLRTQDLKLTMVGPDKGDGSLQKTREMARKLGIIHAVNFSGAIPKEKVPAALAKAHVFLNTTNFDNTPVSIIEALACGLPVVSTNVGGIPYLLENGNNALLIPPDNVDEMVAALGRLLENPELAAQLSRNGRKLAEAFDWSVVLPQWQRLLTNVITSKS